MTSSIISILLHNEVLLHCLLTRIVTPHVEMAIRYRYYIKNGPRTPKLHQRENVEATRLFRGPPHSKYAN